MNQLLFLFLLVLFSSNTLSQDSINFDNKFFSDFRGFSVIKNGDSSHTYYALYNKYESGLIFSQIVIYDIDLQKKDTLIISRPYNFHVKKVFYRKGEYVVLLTNKNRGSIISSINENGEETNRLTKNIEEILFKNKEGWNKKTTFFSNLTKNLQALNDSTFLSYNVISNQEFEVKTFNFKLVETSSNRFKSNHNIKEISFESINDTSYQILAYTKAGFYELYYQNLVKNESKKIEFPQVYIDLPREEIQNRSKLLVAEFHLRKRAIGKSAGLFIYQKDEANPKEKKIDWTKIKLKANNPDLNHRYSLFLHGNFEKKNGHSILIFEQIKIGFSLKYSGLNFLGISGVVGKNTIKIGNIVFVEIDEENNLVKVQEINKTKHIHLSPVLDRRMNIKNVINYFQLYHHLDLKMVQNDTLGKTEIFYLDRIEDHKKLGQYELKKTSISDEGISTESLIIKGSPRKNRILPNKNNRILLLSKNRKTHSLNLKLLDF